MTFDHGTAVEIRSLGDHPGAPSLWISLSVHCLVLLLLFLPSAPRATRVVASQYQTATLIQGKAHISFRTSAALSFRGRGSSSRRPLPVASAKQPSTSEAGSIQVLRQQAEKQTAAITKSLKFRGLFGFYPGHDYQLPVHKLGDLPSISLKQFPDQVAQFVIVEITIDDQGAVADAQIVTGMVVPALQHILLAAVRDFKYIPAKRDGIPIPSQLDIVVPIAG